MYINLSENNEVVELIPDIDPVFPDVPIAERYPTDFIETLIYVGNNANVKCGMVYDKEAETFAYPEPAAITDDEYPAADIPDTGTLTQAEINLEFDYRLSLLELGIN